MNKKQSGFSVIEVLVIVSLLTLVAAAGFLVFQKNQNRGLSAEEIEKKFECNRLTQDFRYTDVFCGNPKFYNNPDNITYDDYYEYYHCEERLKGEPPAESAKNNDPGYYNAYYNCKDPAKLESLRQDFIKELKKLKSENS